MVREILPGIAEPPGSVDQRDGVDKAEEQEMERQRDDQQDRRCIDVFRAKAGVKGGSPARTAFLFPYARMPIEPASCDPRDTGVMKIRISHN